MAQQLAPHSSFSPFANNMSSSRRLKGLRSVHHYLTTTTTQPLWKVNPNPSLLPSPTSLLGRNRRLHTTIRNEANNKNIPPPFSKNNRLEQQKHQALLHKLKRGAAYLLTGTTLLLGASPYIISNPICLSTCLTAVNTVLEPLADVSVGVESVKMGWTVPVEIYGMSVTSTTTRGSSSRGGSSSSSSGSSKKKDSGGGSDGSSTHDKNNTTSIRSTKSTSTSSVVDNNNTTRMGEQQQEENNNNKKKKKTLLSFNKLRTSTTLFQATVLRQPTDIIVTQPYIYAIPISASTNSINTSIKSIDTTTTNSHVGDLDIEVVLMKLGLSAKPHTWDGISSNSIDTLDTVIDTSGIDTAKTSVDDYYSSGMGGGDVVVGVLHYTGEYRIGHVHVSFVDGTATVPQELKDIVGKNVHFEVLEGTTNILEESDSDTDTSWTRQPPNITLPSFAGRFKSPVSMRVDSQYISLSMQGWETSHKYRFLHTPARATIHITRDNIHPVLGRLNPLLNDVVSLDTTPSPISINDDDDNNKTTATNYNNNNNSENQRGGKGGQPSSSSSSVLSVEVTPAASLWPAQNLTITVSPMKVSFGQGAVVRPALQVLNLIDSGFKSLPKKVDVSLSELNVTVNKESGRIDARPLDWRIEIPGKKGIHVVSWGQGSTKKKVPIDMILCIPGDTLSLLGIDTVPEDRGVAFEVTGSIDSPSIDIARASKTIANLAMRQQANRVDRGSLGRWLADGLSSALTDSDGGLVKLPTKERKIG